MTPVKRLAQPQAEWSLPMSRRSPDRVQAFRTAFPRKFLEDVLRAIFNCYELSHEHCQNFFEVTESANLRPFYRRALIEGQLRDAATAHGEVSAVARRSPASGWNHTVVLAGNVAFTQNSAADPDQVVRPSLFRQLYACRDNQQYLFAELEPEELPANPILYGILIHGQSEESPIFPGFARLVFPKEDLLSNWPGHIDLFLEFPEVVRHCTKGKFEEPTAEEVAEPMPELKATPTRKSGGA
jgi:hypothetical protein